MVSDLTSDDYKQSMEESARIQRALLLLDAAEQMKRPEIAKKAVADVMAATKPKNPQQLWTIQGKWAELQRRKLDALLFYRSALDARPATFKPPKNDKLAEAALRLRSELGGTAETQQLWEQKSSASELAKEGRWETLTRDMPAWELSDLKGKTWKMTALEGKTVLINIWATWCEPCKMEQPHLEKLYQQLKGRPDVAILTFNIDEQVGLVEPYMKEKGYTFPVLLAYDYVNTVLPSWSIPRNWIMDAKNKWRLEQIGFGGEQGWEDAMTEKLTSLK